jgi:flagellar export protein FliJ
MKRFSFRLERIRQLRERAERAQAAELGAAMREEQARLAALAAAQEHLERCHEQSAPADGEWFRAGDMLNRSIARDAAAGHTEAASESVKDASDKVADEKAIYGDRRRDLRSVEKLKERQFETWREAGGRAEQKEMDGVALNRHGQGDKKS